MTAASRSAAGGLLGRVLEDLGADLLSPCWVRAVGGEVRLSDVGFYDETSLADLSDRDAVLMVGVPIDRDRITSALRGVRDAGVDVAVFKGDPGDAALLGQLGGLLSVTTLLAPKASSWGHLYSVIRSAIDSCSISASAPAAGIPVGDLFALANAVAAMVGGEVTVEDPQSRVLAFSSVGHAIDEPRRSTILGQRVPDAWLERLQSEGVFRRLSATDEVVRYESAGDPDVRTRLAVAVRAGANILGSIWAVEGEQVLGAEAEEALLAASRIASLHLIRHRSHADVARRARGEELIAVLDGAKPRRAQADGLGLDARGAFQLLAFTSLGKDPAETALSGERLLDLISVAFQGVSRRSVSALSGAVVYVLLPTGSRRDDVVEAVAIRAVESADSALRTSMRGVIGAEFVGLGQAASQRQILDRALGLAVRDDRSIVNVEQMRNQLFLDAVGEALVREGLVQGGVVELIAEHDERHSSAYLATLQAYLDHHGDVSKAATEVFVHPNTLRYRLRRIEELTGIDLSDSDERLALALQLRFGA